MIVSKKYKGMVCEFISDNEMIFTKNGVVYYYKDEVLVSKFRVTSLLVSIFLMVFPIASRLLRLQFYNVIRSSSGQYFICFGHQIYVGLHNKLKRLKFDKKFRVFRDGVAIQGNKIYFGEYFSNNDRGSVNIYSYDHDREQITQEYKFMPKEIRHVHAVRKSKGSDKFLVFTGDLASEARIMEFDSSFTKIQTLYSGTEDFRAIYGLYYNDRVLYATDAQFQTNKLVIEDEARGGVERLYELNGPVFYGAHHHNKVILSVVWEGATAQVGLCAELLLFNLETNQLDVILTRKKDFLSKKYFQFGQYLLPRIEGAPKHIFVTPMGLTYPSGTVIEINMANH
jgi:hypothetical protein